MIRPTPVIAAAVLLLASTSARAQLRGQETESRILSDRFAISAGGFLATVTTDAAIGFGSNLGTFLRLEDTLGLEDNSDTLRVDGFYRFKNKHKLDFSFVDIRRSGLATLDENIDFLKVRFTGDIDSTFDSSQFRLIYQYSFANTGKIEAGIDAGFSTYSYRMSIEGMGELLDAETGEPVPGGTFETRKEDEDIIAPVPVIGAFINFAIDHRTIFRFRSEVLDLSVSNFEGRVVDTRTTVDWFIIRNFGIGGGLFRTDTDVRDTGTDPFSVNYAYGGLVFYIQGVL